MLFPFSKQRKKNFNLQECPLPAVQFSAKSGCFNCDVCFSFFFTTTRSNGWVLFYWNPVCLTELRQTTFHCTLWDQIVSVIKKRETNSQMDREVAGNRNNKTTSDPQGMKHLTLSVSLLFSQPTSHLLILHSFSRWGALQICCTKALRSDNMRKQAICVVKSIYV